MDAPLSKIGGKGLFTKELENELLAGAIDIAVHSLKDMPTELPTGLTIGAISAREDCRDAFLSEKFSSLDELPPGARVGTSSLRRVAQIMHIRPDLNIVDLRGNVDTRIKRLLAGDFEGIILAAAGVKRLGFTQHIKEILPTEKILPSAGQGDLTTGNRSLAAKARISFSGV